MPSRGAEHDPPALAHGEVDFTGPEGLRTLLAWLHEAGSQGWSSPVATRLLRFAQDRYAPLARSWNRPVEDAAAAAFEVMIAGSTLRARDPWAVVTRPVELSLAADAHADRMLISAEHARRPDRRPARVPARTGEHTEALTALAQPAPAAPHEDRVVATCAVVLAVAGWPVDLAVDVIWWLADRIADLGSQESALDTLRRDNLMPRRFGLTSEQWAALLHALVGVPGSPRLGLIVRVLVGEPLVQLLADEELLRAAEAASPAARGAAS